MTVCYLEALASAHHPLSHLIIRRQGSHSEGVAEQKGDIFMINIEDL